MKPTLCCFLIRSFCEYNIWGEGRRAARARCRLKIRPRTAQRGLSPTADNREGSDTYGRKRRLGSVAVVRLFVNLCWVLIIIVGWVSIFRLLYAFIVDEEQITHAKHAGVEQGYVQMYGANPLPSQRRFPGRRECSLRPPNFDSLWCSLHPKNEG